MLQCTSVRHSVPIFFIHKYFGNLIIKTLFAPQRAEKRLRSSRVYYQQKLNCFNWLSGKYALCELQPMGAILRQLSHFILELVVD
jgi:hypothetical protein